MQKQIGSGMKSTNFKVRAEERRSLEVQLSCLLSTFCHRGAKAPIRRQTWTNPLRGYAASFLDGLIFIGLEWVAVAI